MTSQLDIVLKQLALMFLLVCIGYILYKKGMLGNDTTKQLSNLLLYVVNPFLSIVSFIQPYNADKLIGFGVTFIYSIISIFVGLGVGRLIFGKQKRLEQYACGFSNGGFIGIPLVQGLLGNEYIFDLSAFLMAYSLVAWSYGLYLITGKNDFTLKKFITNPAIIAIFVGLLIFIVQIPVPGVIKDTLTMVGNVNTPLGMIILGTYIANDKIMTIFTSKAAYVVSFLKLLIVPVIMIIFMKFAYVPYEEIKMVILIVSCAPCGVTLAMFSQLAGGDYNYGARITSLSTILCPLTILLMTSLAAMLW